MEKPVIGSPDHLKRHHIELFRSGQKSPYVEGLLKKRMWILTPQEHFGNGMPQKIKDFRANKKAIFVEKARFPAERRLSFLSRVWSWLKIQKKSLWLIVPLRHVDIHR